MTTNSYYWHDYETFGTDPKKDRPVQFAGVRTDLAFNIISEPLVVYCKPSEDCLPHPDACLITGITPQLANKKGVCEAEFIRLIHSEIVQSNTCTLGYNNIRFDDEVTRNCLYRNFYDPYGREWQNGNSRWDLLDVVRAAHALRPDGIVWPLNEEGKPCFKLDQITIANDIAHESAHDALSDVYATISIAKLLKQVQPKLYQFLLENRRKEQALNLLALGSFKPVIHVSGKYPAVKNCLAVVLPVCKHPTNSNGIVVYDLSINPEPLLTLSLQDIQNRLFTPAADLPEGVERIPLKTVHINKCPVLAPISVLREEDQYRLQVDMDLCQTNLERIKSAPGLTEKLSAIFSQPTDLEKDSDPDLTIYSGGFFSEADKQKFAKIRSMAPEKLAKAKFDFNDARLPEMLFRYCARNFPESLTISETRTWKTFCKNRLSGQLNTASITFDDYFARLKELKNEPGVNQSILEALEAWGNEKLNYFGLTS